MMVVISSVLKLDGRSIFFVSNSERKKKLSCLKHNNNRPTGMLYCPLIMVMKQQQTTTKLLFNPNVPNMEKTKKKLCNRCLSVCICTIWIQKNENDKLEWNQKKCPAFRWNSFYNNKKICITLKRPNGKLFFQSKKSFSDSFHIIIIIMMIQAQYSSNIKSVCF